ncbi:hypothetical protein PV328_003995, partial [Microctonus aethiopoides]
MGIRNGIWFSRVVRTKDDPVMDSEGTLGRGAMNGGRGLRRQRSLEWRERRGYVAGGQSSSDEESNTRHGNQCYNNNNNSKNDNHNNDNDNNNNRITITITIIITITITITTTTSTSTTITTTITITITTIMTRINL